MKLAKEQLHSTANKKAKKSKEHKFSTQIVIPHVKVYLSHSAGRSVDMVLGQLCDHLELFGMNWSTQRTHWTMRKQANVFTKFLARTVTKCMQAKPAEISVQGWMNTEKKWRQRTHKDTQEKASYSQIHSKTSPRLLITLCEKTTSSTGRMSKLSVINLTSVLDGSRRLWRYTRRGHGLWTETLVHTSYHRLTTAFFSGTHVTLPGEESSHFRKRQQRLPKRQPNNYKVWNS